ncbi:glycoside hydrolase family 36 protein [Actinoplanes sp. GCM10030250]|uniref:glycoside hydrolase family 36 protein n=1 Tax=Actinoplanes sp. GCM10030250 TaxID=3273376 RepID=UPI00361B7C1B
MITWGHRSLCLVIDTGAPVTVRSLTAGDDGASSRSGQPLAELITPGQGRAQVSQRAVGTAIGRRLAYAGHTRHAAGGEHRLELDLRDPVTGLAVRLRFSSADGVPAFRVTTTVRNDGPEPVLLLGVTSFAMAVPDRAGSLDLVHADSEWLGEGRWQRRRLRDSAAPDLNLALHGQDGRGGFRAVSTGTWSTGRRLPTGGLLGDDGRGLLWQVEHNGPWRWETGEQLGGVYVALLGPTDADHQWQHLLVPGEEFETVPVSIAVSDRGGLAGAAAALTAHRRTLVRDHPDRRELPVVFNDYMNTLMGDPTTAKLLPLIDAAAAAGAEVFCVDAGWYDNGTDWWDSVGEWQPSESRFPRGIEEVLARIRERGLRPGLWLEPEVIGVRSPAADKLPAEAFLRRHGERVVEHDRYHLDLRHPAAVAHLDEVVDRLVEQLGVGYLKLDYNVDPGAGTDHDAASAGAGLLGHNRAHLAWLDRLAERHPGLTLENCASGAMRMDYALLSRMQLQSTSDQQDWLRYPPIAAAAPLSILPEQAANWAYPQPEMSDEQMAYALCTGMLGRLYLSGRLDAMSAPQLASVRAAVTAYQRIRAGLKQAVPIWPSGLPGWDDPWISLGLVTGGTTHLGVWKRGGPAVTRLDLPHLKDSSVRIEVLYPVHLRSWSCSWDPAAGVLEIDAGDTGPAARLFTLSPQDR